MTVDSERSSASAKETLNVEVTESDNLGTKCVDAKIETKASEADEAGCEEAKVEDESAPGLPGQAVKVSQLGLIQ